MATSDTKWNNLLKFVCNFSDTTDFDLKLFYQLVCRYTIEKSTVQSGSTLLHFAALGEESLLLKKLIALSPKEMINAENERGETPLHWACQSGNLDSVKLLIQYGGNTFCADVDRNSILHWCVNAGHHKVVKFLLEKDYVYINAKNKDGKTCLDICVDDEDYEMALILLKYAECETISSSLGRMKKSSTELLKLENLL